MQDFATGYQGPAVVACADGPERLWIRYKGSVLRVALENVRLATSEEEMGPRFIVDALQTMEEELTGNRRPPGYEEDEGEPGTVEAVGPFSGDLPSGSPGEVQFHSGKTGCSPKGGVLDAGPSDAVAQVPKPTVEIVDLAKESADRCRMLDGLPRKFRSSPYEFQRPPSVSEKIEFFEKGGVEDILADAGGKLAATSSLQRFSVEKDIWALDKAVEKGFHEHVRQRDDGGEAMLKTPRVGEEVGEATLPIWRLV